MLEDFEKGTEISKEEYEKELLELRTELIKTQYLFRKYKRPMILVLTGLDGAGKGEMVNTLADVMDSRLMEVSTFWQETDEENERPYHWRFWNAMPTGGKLGVYFNGWYEKLIRTNIETDETDEHYIEMLKSAEKFERMLALDGTVIVKVWAHLSKKEQKKRHDRLTKKFEQTPEVTQRANWYYSKYEKIAHAAELAYKTTHSEFAPWEIIDCTDKRHRELRFLRVILEGMKKALEDRMPRYGSFTSETISFPDRLGAADLTQKADSYKKDMAKLITEIKPLSWEAYERGISSMIVFEGWDAAGKGGCIRRLLRAVDMRLSKVISIAAPTQEEISRHYLWRFWRQVPRAGHMTVFDRSWYGRVLVERVEGFAKHAEWFRAYDEINDFEAHLADRGVVLSKFFLHISSEEQMNRFKLREETEWKKHKITDEDYRNREKTPDYTDAYNEMLFKTDTIHAPWHVIPANDKKYARIEVLREVKKMLEKSLKK